MGTKRAFEEDLQEFLKHPKHLDYGNKQASVTETKFRPESVQVLGIPGIVENTISVPDMVVKQLELNEPLPLVTGMDTSEEDDSGPGPMFSPNFFSELFEYNIPRRPLFHYEDIYSSLLNRNPRKEIPIGPNHQADVPEFDSETAKRYREDGGMEHFLGICVISPHHSVDSSHDVKVDCKCCDHGSVRCVQQHVKEARANLKKCYGHEKFVELGMVEMGEEVANRWSEEEERLFHEVVYSNPVSVGRMFWKQLAVAFPSRTKKEFVSYYFNVFILRRRAVQNRVHYLDTDSDDDEWHGSYGVEDDDFVVGDHASVSEDDIIDDVIGMDDKKADVESFVTKNENSVVIEREQETGRLTSKCCIFEEISRGSKNGENGI